MPLQLGTIIADVNSFLERKTKQNLKTGSSRWQGQDLCVSYNHGND